MTASVPIDTKQPSDLRWWKAKRGETADAVWSAFEIARDHDEGRRDRYTRCRQIYESGISEASDENTDTDDSVSHVSRDNIVASIIETAESKLLEHRPDPMILTSGGNPELRQQAELLTQWTKAACEEIGLHDVVEKAWMEAMVCGSGAYRVFERDGEPACEIVFCEDVFVDPEEAHHECVMTYYRQQVIDRGVLVEMYPDHKGSIEGAASSAATEIEREKRLAANDSSTADMVTVVTAWRVAPSKRRPGRVAVVLHGGQSNVLLDNGEYDDRRPPFTFFHYRRRSRAFWGTGLVTMLAPIQAEIDEMGEIIDESLSSFVPQAWVEEGSVKVKEVDDETGCYYTYSGKPPLFFDPSGQAAMGQRQWQETRMQRGYHMAGVSSTEAGAMKEAGLNSGKALNVHQDIKSQRLVRKSMHIEDGYKDGFRRVIDVADQIVADEDERGDDPEEHVTDARMVYLAGSGEDLRELSYFDARISDAMFKCEIYPVSKLADSPAARFQQVTEMMNSGLFEQEEGLDLLDFPDVKAATEARLATKRWARKLVDLAARGEKMAAEVSPLDDLPEIIRYGTVTHALMRYEGVSLEKLQNVRDVITRAESEQRKLTAPPPGAPPAGAAPAPPPPGADGMMPAPPMPPVPTM